METLIKLYSFYGGKHAYYNCRMRQSWKHPCRAITGRRY
ncbi:hypothetical protein RUMOBE_00979 [Blautia obeum ATCC 29174]|uniref:Uncharacterized protein n=1 Tax=Blautia obeum ATCC 29174 TaxID=411459 RepID=A5ZPR2_9FIRM|nr:hypothetical protein RUMOBE_00979 [Blautia obeum ATCC 29174]